MGGWGGGETNKKRLSQFSVLTLCLPLVGLLYFSFWCQFKHLYISRCYPFLVYGCCILFMSLILDGFLFCGISLHSSNFLSKTSVMGFKLLFVAVCLIWSSVSYIRRENTNVLCNFSSVWIYKFEELRIFLNLLNSTYLSFSLWVGDVLIATSCYHSSYTY